MLNENKTETPLKRGLTTNKPTSAKTGSGGYIDLEEISTVREIHKDPLLNKVCHIRNEEGEYLVPSFDSPTLSWQQTAPPDPYWRLEATGGDLYHIYYYEVEAPIEYYLRLEGEELQLSEEPSEWKKLETSNNTHKFGPA